MLRTRFLLVPLVTASAALAPFAQERVKPKQPTDFDGCLSAASTAWKERRFGACTKQLQDAMALVADMRADAIRSALPGAPEGYEIVPEEKDAMAANPMLAAMTASVGSVIQRQYRAQNGRSTIEVTVTADSPLVGMFNMWIANPAMVGEGAEVVKYGPYNALLKKEGQRRNLQILIEGSNVCEVRWPNEDEDALFAMFDQQAVNTLARALKE